MVSGCVPSISGTAGGGVAAAEAAERAGTRGQSAAPRGPRSTWVLEATLILAHAGGQKGAGAAECLQGVCSSCAFQSPPCARVGGELPVPPCWGRASAAVRGRRSSDQPRSS